MKFKFYILKFLFLIISCSVFSKNSLTEKIYDIIEIIDHQNHHYKSLSNADKVIKIAQLLKDTNLVAEAYLCRARVYYNLGNYSAAKTDLNFYKSIADSTFFNWCDYLNSYGLIKKSEGEFSSSMQLLLNAMDCYKSKNNKIGESSVLNNIAIIYYMQGNYQKAIEIWKEKYLKLLNENNKDIYSPLNNIGASLHKLGKINEAINYYKKALAIAINNKDSNNIAYSYENIGASYVYINKIDSALVYYYRSKHILDKLNNNLLLSELYFNMAGAFIDVNIDSAMLYSQKAYELSKNHDNKDALLDAYFALYNVYEVKGNYEKAFYYLNLYADLKNNILNEKSINKTAELEAIYNNKSKSLEIENLKKDQELKENEIKNKVVLSWFLIGGLIILIISLFLMFRNYKIKKKTNELLKEKNKIITIQKHLVVQKNKEITDSIQYAKRIQNAILPSEEQWQKYLPSSFVFYLPKDIVAGDFYWLETGADALETTVYFAAADCTGHGVPGAMVSVVCSNALTKAVIEEKITEPGKILDRTRELVIERFAKSSEDVKDGMDISLCAIDFKNMTLQWAGANNPLWIVRKNEHRVAELVEAKPDKQPIGKVENPQPFTTHTIKLQKGDSIYLFTDGFADQFGGEKGKKFKYKPFKELLLSIQDISMDEQKQIIEETFIKWKGDLEQVDDVCVMGVRI